MLSYADYIVLAVALLISASIGIYYRRQTNANDYLLAGGTMSPLPVAFSLMASFMSAITLLGVTNENFAYGTQFIVINIAYCSEFSSLFFLNYYIIITFWMTAFAHNGWCVAGQPEAVERNCLPEVEESLLPYCLGT